jgi:hypothetical protein
MLENFQQTRISCVADEMGVKGGFEVLNLDKISFGDSGDLQLMMSQRLL